MMLHPFLCSQAVWQTVAEQLADTGEYHVFAPTMVGHNGGRKATSWAMGHLDLVDDVERRMDELGWDTAHVVSNSLGGWVAFELERRGRARSLTAIAPAGGWSQHSLTKYETVLKFLAGGPVLAAARLLGPRILGLPFARRIATLAVQRSRRRAESPRPAQADRRRDALHGVLPAAGQDAATARPAGVGQRRGPYATGAVREGQGLSPPAGQPVPGRQPAARDPGGASGRPRPHPDARGAGSSHRADRRLRRIPRRTRTADPAGGQALGVRRAPS